MSKTQTAKLRVRRRDAAKEHVENDDETTPLDTHLRSGTTEKTEDPQGQNSNTTGWRALTAY